MDTSVRKMASTLLFVGAVVLLSLCRHASAGDVVPLSWAQPGSLPDRWEFWIRTPDGGATMFHSEPTAGWVARGGLYRARIELTPEARPDGCMWLVAVRGEERSERSNRVRNPDLTGDSEVGNPDRNAYRRQPRDLDCDGVVGGPGDENVLRAAFSR